MTERESRFMRIPANSLSAIPTKSGTILKGEHMSILKKVLARGVNENRIDLNKLFNGKTDIIVAYSLEGLDDALNLSPAPVAGDYAILYNDKDNSIEGEFDGILIYQLSPEGAWEFVERLSLINMLTRLKKLEDADYAVKEEIVISETLPEVTDGLKLWIKPLEQEEILEEPDVLLVHEAYEPEEPDVVHIEPEPANIEPEIQEIIPE